MQSPAAEARPSQPNLLLIVSEDTHATAANYHPQRAVCTDRYKLIETFDPEGIEIYSLSDDHGETKNLAATQTAKVNELRRELDAWRRTVGAEMMKPNPDYDSSVPAPKKKKTN